MKHGHGQKAEQERPGEIPPDQHHQRGQQQIDDQERQPSGTRVQGQKPFCENQIQGAMRNAQNNHQHQHHQQLDIQRRKWNPQRGGQTGNDRGHEQPALGIDGVHAGALPANRCLRNGPAGNAAMTAA